MSTNPLRKTHVNRRGHVSFEYPHDYTLAQQGITAAGSVKTAFGNYYRQTLRFAGFNTQGKPKFKSFIN